MRRLLPLILAALISFPAFAAEPFIEKVDVFQAGERGYRTYRIPGIVVTTKGTLLAYGEARKGSKSDWGVIDVWMRRSRDGGQQGGWAPLTRDERGRGEPADQTTCKRFH